MSFFVYELNTWVWLDTLSRRHGRRVLLGDVPPAEWDALARRGIDALWFMGVWERSPEGRRIAIEEAGLDGEYRGALPDYRAHDVVGSPYSIQRYRVEELLGGPDGLAAARAELRRRDLRLILDFVPNHVAPDHPWVLESPECFVPGDAPGTVAHGKDPNYAPWTDTAQLNAFSPELRRRARETLLDIAAQCDGVRCDMAMLMLNEVFARTWQGRAGPPPETEYWVDVLAGVSAEAPDFLFLAEAYWDLEWKLREVGFDYCYDKRLYDRLVHGDADSLRAHLSASLEWQRGLIRFIENHDEPRAATAFPPDRHRAAAVILSTLPGAKLFFHGQFAGRRVRLPVQLGREPEEADDPAVAESYARLLSAARRLPFEDGLWTLLECTGWPDNQSCRNLLVWAWNLEWLVVVNYSPWWSQGTIFLRLPPGKWRFADVLSSRSYDRPGDEPLYVELPPWGSYLFSVSRV